jgi:hypothetical protein
MNHQPVNVRADANIQRPHAFVIKLTSGLVAAASPAAAQLFIFIMNSTIRRESFE